MRMMMHEAPALSRRKTKWRKQQGLTLVELLVVLLILSFIAAFAVPRVMNYVGGARTDSAAIQIDRLGGILDLYRLDIGRYPSSAEGLEVLFEPPAEADRWNGPYVKKASSLIDPWGNPYQYEAPGEHGEYDLYSLGADGQDGGDGEDADVTSW